LLIESIVISLIIGLLVKGRVKHLISLELRVPWILFMALGTLLNFLVLIFNAGFMPVEVEVPLAMGFEEAGEALSQGMVFGHKVMAADDLLKSLGDIVHIPPPYPFPKTISFGDLLIGIGTGMLIVPHMKKKES